MKKITILSCATILALFATTTFADSYGMQAQPRPYGGDPNAFENNTGYNRYYSGSSGPDLESIVRAMEDGLPGLNLGGGQNNTEYDDNWSTGYDDDPEPYYPTANPGYSQQQIDDAKWSILVAKRTLESITYQYENSNSAVGLSDDQASEIVNEQYMYSYYYTRCLTSQVYNDKQNIRNILNSFSGDAQTRRMNGHTAGMARNCLRSSKRNGHTNGHDPLLDDHLSQWNYQ